MMKDKNLIERPEKTTSCTPQHIANFFLEYAKKEEKQLTQLKLMKLVYIAYGWYLAITHEKLFEESIAAWKHGPVIESLYHEFKHFKKKAIDSNSITFDLDTGSTIFPSVKDSKIIEVLEIVWNGYKDFTAESMVNREHKEDTAWFKHFKQSQNIVIPPQDIEEDFYQRIKLYINAKRQQSSKP